MKQALKQMVNSTEKYKRYQRQILLKEFGVAAQEKLQNSRVLVIGAGGLGCPALQYLSAAGVGCLGIVDFDVVDLSNLHRQILYTSADVGKSKAKVAGRKIKKLNPEIYVKIFDLKVTKENALELIEDYDVIIDGSDNFKTKYLINDACVLLHKPLIYGAIFSFEGQVGVFNIIDKVSNSKSNYRDLFPSPPNQSLALSCNTNGVIGVLPGVIGVMQALEAIKIVTDVGKPLCNKIISFNALTNCFYDFEIEPSVQSFDSPKTKAEFLNFNYDWFCNSVSPEIKQLSVDEFDSLRLTKSITVIDVREVDELPVLAELSAIKIPLSNFEKSLPSHFASKTIVVVCKTGKRSRRAVEILNKKFQNYIFYSLDGGIESWTQTNKNLKYEK